MTHHKKKVLHKIAKENVKLTVDQVAKRHTLIRVCGRKEAPRNVELEVGQIFFGKRKLSMKLWVVVIKKNIKFRIKRVLYVNCVDENCV